MTICKYTLGYVNCKKELLELDFNTMYDEMINKCKECNNTKCRMCQFIVNDIDFSNLFKASIRIRNIDNEDIKILKKLGFK